MIIKMRYNWLSVSSSELNGLNREGCTNSLHISWVSSCIMNNEITVHTYSSMYVIRAFCTFGLQGQRIAHHMHPTLHLATLNYLINEQDIINEKGGIALLIWINQKRAGGGGEFFFCQMKNDDWKKIQKF